MPERSMKRCSHCGQMINVCGNCGKIFCPRCNGRECPECGRTSGGPVAEEKLSIGLRAGTYHE